LRPTSFRTDALEPTLPNVTILAVLEPPVVPVFDSLSAAAVGRALVIDQHWV
jgi:hypothetical protein